MREMTRVAKMKKKTPGTIQYEEVPPVGESKVFRGIYIEHWFAQGAKEVEVTIKVND